MILAAGGAVRPSARLGDSVQRLGVLDAGEVADFLVLGDGLDDPADDLAALRDHAKTGIAYPAATAKVAYYACVVLFSWLATFGTIG